MKGSFTARLAVRLFFIKLGASSMVSGILGPFLVLILDRFIKEGILKLELTTDALSDGTHIEEFKAAAKEEYAKAMKRGLSETEKQKIREEFLNTLAPIAEFGNGVR